MSDPSTSTARSCQGQAYGRSALPRYRAQPHDLPTCRWCDCPADYGPSTTVYNRFNRWSHRGFWLKLLDALVAGAVTRSTAIDSTYVKAQRAAFGAKGRRSAQAIGRSRGGWTTKVHALTDVIRRPYHRRSFIGSGIRTRTASFFPRSGACCHADRSLPLMLQARPSGKPWPAIGLSAAV